MIPASGIVRLALQVYIPTLILEMSLNTSWPVLLFIIGSLPLEGTGLPLNSQVMVGMAKTLTTVVAVQVRVMASLQISPLRDVIAVDTTGAGRAKGSSDI